MAGLFDKQAKEYADARPTYAPSLFSELASLTPNHCLAWDVGAGNGQASVAIAEHYERVIATDVSKQQLDLAQQHPRLTYAVTTPVLTDEELFSIVGLEGSVDLVTVAMAVHWFDLETFYSQVKRLLRKPGGVIAVWGYKSPSVSPALDELCRKFFESTMGYWNPVIEYMIQGYRNLPFPFQPVLPGGEGCEGRPAMRQMEHQVSLEGYVGLFKSWSAVVTARKKGVELLSDDVLGAFKEAWGDEHAIRTCTWQVFLLAGTAPL